MTTRCRLHGKYPVSNHIPACTLTAHAYFPPQTECFHCKCRKCALSPQMRVSVSSGQKPAIHFIRAGHSFTYTSTRRTYSYILPYVTSHSLSFASDLFICSQHVCLHPFLLLFISLSFITLSIFYFSVHTPSQVPNSNPKTPCEWKKSERV